MEYNGIAMLTTCVLGPGFIIGRQKGIQKRNGLFPINIKINELLKVTQVKIK
jgi:hypothetical protein